MDQYKKRKYTVSKYVENQKIKNMDINFLGNPTADVYVPDQLQPTGLPVDTTMSIQALNLVQQIDLSVLDTNTQTQRIGNKIAMEKLETILRLDSYLAYTAPNYIRMSIVYDRNVNGAYPVTGDIYGANLQDGSVITGQLDLPFNNINTDRFKVLYDKLQCLPPIVTGGIGQFSGPSTQESFVFNESIDLCCLETQYLGNDLNESGGLTISNITTGALYLILIGDRPPGTNPWIMMGSTRLYFKDC